MTRLNYQGEELRGKSFRGMDLDGADFTEADLRGADFTGASLVGADFTNARLGVHPLTGLVILAVTLAIAIAAANGSGTEGHPRIAANGQDGEPHRPD